MNLMATGTYTQRAPCGLLYRRLPFYSHFHTNGTAGADVFSHNVNRMPGSLRPCFGYCFPQPSLVGVVSAHLSKCKARAVIVVPNTRTSWIPIIEGERDRSIQIASLVEDSQFFRVHHQRGAEPYTFGRRDTRAVEVDNT